MTAESPSHLETLKSLIPYLWPKNNLEARARVVIAGVCLLSAKVANLYVPLFYKQAIDQLNPDDIGVIVIPLGLILAYGGARVMSLVFAELRDILFSKVGQRAVRQISVQVFNHLHWLSLRFHLERKTGKLSRSLERGARALETLLRFSLFNIFPTLTEIVLTGFILWFLFDIWFTAVTLGTIGTYIVLTFIISEWRTKFRREMNTIDSKANSRAIDSLLNYETVKYFNKEGLESRRYDQTLAAYEKAAILSTVSLSVLNIAQAVIIACGLTAVMLMAAQGIQEGSMTIGDFVLVNTYLMQLYIPLNFFGFIYREVKQALTDLEELFALLDVNREIADKPGVEDLKCRYGEVVFDRVCFSYESRREILSDISFRISPGQTVALVGASGSGKSTIARLLFRFYDIDAGRILIDGQDIREVKQTSLRAAMGVVPQDTVLFNDTISYNIGYGHPEYRGEGEVGEEIERAAQLASISEFIESLPDKYYTFVGERGLKLSGGEKQRVAIARTILKNPPILIFDEATSALDTHTEREIQASLVEVSTGRTTLVIAHRLSTIIEADEILVLEEGRIIERGKHRDLILREGTYARMWRSQQESSPSFI